MGSSSPPSVERSRHERAGTRRPTDKPIDWTQDGIGVTGSVNHGELTFDKTHVDEATGVTTVLKSKITITPCPDASGRFDAHATVDVTVSKGSASQTAVIVADVEGEIDDDARLVSSTVTGSTNWTDSAGAALGRGPGADVFEKLLGDAMLRNAERSWESGGCVRIDITGAGEVRVGAVVDVLAAPRSAIDGSPTGGNVIATFSGKLSAEPMNSPVPADATFVYRAPTESGSGSLSFVSRSRRGVGKGTAAMHATAPRYIISGSGPEIVFSGITDDVDTSFYVTGTFPGGTAEFDFSTDIDGEGNRLDTGVVTIAGSGNGVTLTGSGTFTMAGPHADGTYTADVDEHSCVHVPPPLPRDVCKSSRFTLTFTPEY